MLLNTKLVECGLGLLKCVSDTLSDIKAWTTGTEARNVDGDSVAPSSSDAVSWCVIGAVFKCANDAGYSRSSPETLLALRFLNYGLVDAQDSFFEWGAVPEDETSYGFGSIPGIPNINDGEAEFEKTVRPAIGYALGAMRGLLDEAVKADESAAAKADKPEPVAV